MVGYITESTGGNYEPTPEGGHLAVCARIVDLGTQDGGQYGPKHKVRIFWELPEVRQELTAEDGTVRSVPALHSEQYSVSFHEKATLRKTLESWRGTKFTEADFSGPPNGFHMSKLIGIPAMIQIVHDVKPDGKVYSNLNSIMKPMKMVFDEYKGKIEGDSIFFDLDDFDQSAFDKLSDRLKETVQKSPEYQALFPSGAMQNQGHGDPGVQPDDIAF